MDKELYRLVNSDGVKLDENFLNHVFEIIISNEKGLDDFISDFIINNNIDAFGTYSNQDRIISINQEKLLTNETGVLGKGLNKKIYAIHVIRHEIEHAKSLMRLYEGRDDIESLIVRYSLVDYIKKNHLNLGISIKETDDLWLRFKKFENYEVDPGERLADIRASKFIVNLLKNHGKTNDLLLARSMLYYSYIRGYKDNRYYLDAPTFTYLINMGMFHEYYFLKKRVDEKDYSLDTRVIFGLPITYEEKDRILLKKAKLQRKRI